MANAPQKPNKIPTSYNFISSFLPLSLNELEIDDSGEKDGEEYDSEEDDEVGEGYINETDIQLHFGEKEYCSTSKYRGVSRLKRVHTTLWQSQIKVNGKMHYLGHYATEEEAARAFDDQAARFGRELNFPDEWEGTKVLHGVKRSSSSKYRGVYRRKNVKGSRTWQAEISINGSTKYLGTYATEEEAARAFDDQAARLGRELNFPHEVIQLPCGHFCHRSFISDRRIDERQKQGDSGSCSGRSTPPVFKVKCPICTQQMLCNNLDARDVCFPQFDPGEDELLSLSDETCHETTVHLPVLRPIILGDLIE